MYSMKNSQYTMFLIRLCMCIACTLRQAVSATARAAGPRRRRGAGGDAGAWWGRAGLLGNAGELALVAPPLELLLQVVFVVCPAYAEHLTDRGQGIPPARANARELAEEFVPVVQDH